MISLQFHNTITERDMDLLLAESVCTDPGFCRLLIDKTDLKGKPFQLVGAELSKTDNDLGESDVTVILDVEGRKYALLIEDKIDAVAMPEQHARYVKRGKKGIKDGEYDGFLVFLFCPEKYYRYNEEAKRYEHLLTYEECREYFDDKTDPLSAFRSRQLEQAIDKAKKPQNVNVNEQANAFLRQYIRYQKEHYPELVLTTREDRNGWWTDFRTNLGSAYINHKIQEGSVDLTFLKPIDDFGRVQSVAKWAWKHNVRACAVGTKKSAMLSISVPKLDILQGFENVDPKELNKCFKAVRELTEFANMIHTASSIAAG